MNKVLSVAKTVLAWVFVVFCLLMAIGCGSASGSTLFLITAVLSVPLKIIRNLWDTALGIKEIPDLPEETSAKWYQVKKKKEQKAHNNAVEDQKKRRFFKPLIITVAFIVSFAVAMENSETVSTADSVKESTEVASIEVTEEVQETVVPTETPSPTQTPKPTATPTVAPTVTPEPTKTPEPSPEVVAKASEEFSLSNVAVYSGSPYVEINQNVPYFADSELSKTSYEYYSDLDSLGRCGVCVASVGQDIMPTEKRGDIGSVKPTGWHTVKYAGVVDGNYLYNRCHLIGYQLTGENANNKNLITGTRYLNVEGMLPFENMVADYVKETGNHVMYRVTPVFDGNNLLASGALMEAKSVEDNGAGILFNVFCYNVQPGVTIDYATGDSALDGSVSVKEQSTPKPEVTQAPVVTTPTPQPEQQPPSATGSYVVNAKNGKIHIVGACPATGTGDNAMTEPVYFNTYEEAESYSISIAPNQSKRKCGNCYR